MCGKGVKGMNKRKLTGALAGVMVLATSAFYGYQRWGGSGNGLRNDVLAQIPANANTVLYIDLDDLRKSPFLAELYKWAPQPTADSDYAQFLQYTGFNYERDLNRVGVAFLKHGQDTTLFAIVNGQFDRKKISAYASRTGTRETRSGKEIFSVPLSGSTRRIMFTFLRDDRIALTNDASLESSLSPPRSDSDAEAWRERFRRLAGSPVFAVMRQDGAAGTTLSAQAPGGLQSPQLTALIDQLQWITVAAKPDADQLRLVVECESASDATAHQLADVLNGILVLAQAGLSEPKVREQLAPDVRQAYLDLLKSADVSKLDRGDTKSVRLILSLTPQFLNTARTSSPFAPPALTAKPRPHGTLATPPRKSGT
jgi:hypothetical protein